MAANIRHRDHLIHIAVFAMLGVIMYLSDILMEFLPNVHLIAFFIVVLTLVYRGYALIPIYIYVIINGIYSGFSMWWFPYTYIWTILWGLTMLLPKNLPKLARHIIYPILCGLHGFAFGTLYAPAQALMFGMNTEQMVAWIIAGLPWDFIHCLGNLAAGLLIIP